MVCQWLDVDVGRGGENMGGNFLHEAAHQLENYQAGGDNNQHYDNIAGGKEDKLKEVADERDGEGGSHNADNRDKESGAEFVERAGNPIN